MVLLLVSNSIGSLLWPCDEPQRDGTQYLGFNPWEGYHQHFRLPETLQLKKRLLAIICLRFALPKALKPNKSRLSKQQKLSCLQFDPVSPQLLNIMSNSLTLTVRTDSHANILDLTCHLHTMAWTIQVLIPHDMYHGLNSRKVPQLN